MIRHTLALAAFCALALCACATAPPTASSCAAKQAELAAAQASLPTLEAAVSGALNAQQQKDAQTARTVAEALIAADQAYVAGQCVAVTSAP